MDSLSVQAPRMPTGVPERAVQIGQIEINGQMRPIYVEVQGATWQPTDLGRITALFKEVLVAHNALRKNVSQVDDEGLHIQSEVKEHSSVQGGEAAWEAFKAAILGALPVRAQAHPLMTDEEALDLLSNPSASPSPTRLFPAPEHRTSAFLMPPSPVLVPSVPVTPIAPRQRQAATGTDIKSQSSAVNTRTEEGNRDTRRKRAARISTDQAALTGRKSARPPARDHSLVGPPTTKHTLSQEALDALGQHLSISS